MKIDLYILQATEHYVCFIQVTKVCIWVTGREIAH